MDLQNKKSEWNIQKHSEPLTEKYSILIQHRSIDYIVRYTRFVFHSNFHNVPVTRCEHMKKAEDISILFSGLPQKNPPKSEHSRRAAGRRFASKCSQGKFKNFFKLNIKLQVVFTLHRSDVSSTQNHAHEQRVNKADLSSMLK